MEYPNIDVENKHSGIVGYHENSIIDYRSFVCVYTNCFCLIYS